MKTTEKIDKSDLPGIYKRLTSMMQNVSFDAQMLNIAVLRNQKTIQKDAERLINKKEEIFNEYAERWGEDEEVPEGASVGDRKTVSLGDGVTRPRYPDKASRLEAEKELSELFDGKNEYTLDYVPPEAFETPEGTPMGIWEDLDFMFQNPDA